MINSSKNDYWNWEEFCLGDTLKPVALCPPCHLGKPELRNKIIVFPEFISSISILCILESSVATWVIRDGFKTQPPVDRRFRPVPPSFCCSKQWQPPGTGRNRRSTGGWVLKPPLSKKSWTLYSGKLIWNQKLKIQQSILKMCVTRTAQGVFECCKRTPERRDNWFILLVGKFVLLCMFNHTLKLV